MITIYLFFAHLVRRIRIGLRDPEFRGLFYTTLIIVAVGGWFYHLVEGWSWLDSYYFTVITLTTVGYGDFAPQTSLGKIFTMLYVVLGLGIISSFILLLAQQKDEQPPRMRLFRARSVNQPTNPINNPTNPTKSPPEENQP